MDSMYLRCSLEVLAGMTRAYSSLDALRGRKKYRTTKLVHPGVGAAESKQELAGPTREDTPARGASARGSRGLQARPAKAPPIDSRVGASLHPHFQAFNVPCTGIVKTRTNKM